jgi:hypothetical protein
MAASVPTAIPALTSIFQGALPDNFQVGLGQVFTPYIAPQTLLITGIHFTEDEYAEMAPTYKHEEHYNVQCCLISTAGDNGYDAQASRLQEVYTLYQGIQVAVANNPNISNTVRLGWCRQLDYMPSADIKGMSAGVLNFEVEIQARVTSLT